MIASAGGIPALIEIISALRPDFPIPLFIAQHLPRVPLPLDKTLACYTSLPVRWAEAGPLTSLKGIYLAPPGTGILLTLTGIEIDELPAPSASWLASGDQMIRSIFARFGSRTAAIVLSGMLPAGIEGIRVVRQGGGVTMAQDRNSRRFEMPSAAIDFGKAEIICAPAGIARVLNMLPDLWEEARERAA